MARTGFFYVFLGFGILWSINGYTCVGTDLPTERLHVEGNIWATGTISSAQIEADGGTTGDLLFRKEGRKLWRMFEDEEGLYPEDLSTGETSRVFLEKDVDALVGREIRTLKDEFLEEAREEIVRKVRKDLLIELSVDQ